MPPAFLQSASVFAFVTSAANAGPMKATAKKESFHDVSSFMLEPNAESVRRTSTTGSKPYWQDA